MPGSWYRFDAERDRLILNIRVQPNASHTEISGFHDGCLRIRVAAPPLDDRANALLIDFPKKKLELPGGRVMIQRGSHGRDKIIEISHPGTALLASVRLLPQS